MAVQVQAAAGRAPRHLLGLDGLSEADFGALLDLAAVMKRHPLAWRTTLEGRAIACLFEQPSTRSRASLHVAIHRLGALPVTVVPAELEEGDALAEIARVLSSYCDAIAVRTPRHRDLLELAEHASVPVVNALTDREHPCRALADCLTLRSRFGGLRGLPVAYLGGRAAVGYSLVEAAMLSGIELRVAAPARLRLDPELLARAGQTVRICDTDDEAIDGAVAVYADDRHRELASLAAPRAVLMTARALPEQAANLLGIHAAMLRVLVTGDWEI
jgi:ornithine carbamoyltransferase